MDVVELLRWGAKCEASGDLDGALKAFVQADELGDAEGAVLLGQVYRQRGETGLAEAAFSRGEARGHAEAAMCLGNLLSDLGNGDGAEAAYRRAIAAGSTMAVLNLGLLLGDQGRVDEALGHLRRAEAVGDAYASCAVARLLEQKGDLVGAVEAYRRGADADNAQAAFGLGCVLMELGDELGARAAFQQARDLGDKRGNAMIEVFAIAGQSETTGSISAADVSRQLEAVDALQIELASQRSQMRRAWILDTRRFDEKQARALALSTALEERSRDVAELKAGLGEIRKRELYFAQSQLPSDDPDDWLERGSLGTWTFSSERAKEFDRDLREARVALFTSQNKVFKSHYKETVLRILALLESRLGVLARACQQAESERTVAERAREQNANGLRKAALEATGKLHTVADSSMRDLPAPLQPWPGSQWATWVPGQIIPGLRVGFGGTLVVKADSDLGTNSAFGASVRIPWVVPLHSNWFISHDGQNRDAAKGFIRSLMLRHLASVMPGESRFCVFDPVGLGQSVGDLLDLGEYDADLIGGKVWTSAQDLDGRLAELADQVELVIQKYLRTTYKSIDDYNDAAGEVAEPYRVLVLFDYPEGLTAQSAARLKSIVENGPRCGVFTIIAHDKTIQAPYGVDPTKVAIAMRQLNLSAVFTETIQGYELKFDFEPEVLPERSPVAKRVIDLIGRQSLARTDAAVTFDKAFELFNGVAARGFKTELSKAADSTRVGDPSTWWRDDSTRGLSAPIGQKGARDAAILTFDSSDHAGALLVGRPGSGKTTLLHTYIGGLTTLYGPEELELYLIDFKEGVEFKAYAEVGLPHAKVVAVESDREFGLSVLESLQSEMSRRGELLRATGGLQAGMQAWREATGEQMPRVLLVFDEFQVLFSRNDKLGMAAADLLESIIRQGRGFGIHVLLGSQSLAGMDALGAHVHQLLPVRILLPATDTDARKVLGETNNAGDYLTTAGEGILNTAGGAVEKNERFKGALLVETDRIERIEAMRKKADHAGFTRRPMVFEGNAMEPLDSLDARQFREETAATGIAPVRLRTGRPMAIGDVGDLRLTREAGSNVLAVVRAGDADGIGVEPASGPAYGLLVSAVASAAMTDAAIDIIDFQSPDDGLDSTLEPFLDTGRITLRRRRAFSDLLDHYAAAVADRVERDDTRAPTRVLFLFGVHRARELDADSASLDADTDLIDKLERVMRDGPEVGVHVWLWADSLGGASRRMTSRMMREIGWRIAGKMNADDSGRFIGTSQANELRESQLMLTNDDRGLANRLTAYAVPCRAWLTTVCSLAQGPKEE